MQLITEKAKYSYSYLADDSAIDLVKFSRIFCRRPAYSNS